MSSRIVIFLLLMAGLYPITELPGMTAPEEDHDIFSRYRRRCEYLFSYTDTTRKENYFFAAAKLVRGQDRETGIRMIEHLLQDPGASSRGMFVIYELMAAYLYGRDVLPRELKERIWRSFRERPLYRGDTENHWVMYYTGLYLAAQTWPEYPGRFWFTGKNSRENFQEAEEFLNFWMKTTTTIGQGEFDSPTYMMVFLAPMLTLYQFARDSVMKKKAQMMVHYLLADFAVEHLQGLYCGAHSRDYPQNAVAPVTAPSTAWAWLFFEQTKPVIRPEILAAALSDYRMPEIIFHIASDRSNPYVHVERKRVRNIIRFSSQRNPPVFKYTYMSKYFCLGSMQGGILQPIQQHTWDVTWVSKSPYSTLFSLHPYVSGKELGMFFPEEMKFSVAEVSRFHSYYGDENKWVSSSPFEQTFQYRNVLLVLYNIPKGTRFEHIDAFFPKSLDARIFHPLHPDSPLPDRWIFCRANKTYIAYFPLQPYEWLEEEFNWRLRSRYLKNGCIVEVSSAEEYPSFISFQKVIKSNPVQILISGQELTVAYTTTNGDALRFTYDGARVLNGKPIHPDTTLLFDGPFLHAKVGSEKLILTYQGKSMILDFTIPAIIENPK